VQQSEVEKLASSVSQNVHTLQEEMKRATSIKRPAKAVDDSSNEHTDKQMNLEKYIRIVEELRCSATTYFGTTHDSAALSDDAHSTVQRD
jgi:hypothetical protein